MAHTFELGLALNRNLELNTSIEDKISSYNSLVKELGSDLEQADDSTNLVSGIPNIVGLAHKAFAKHRHMILDPDSIWCTIERGLAIHITENAEELRHQFVEHEGKVFIEIRRDSFVMGGKNDWEGCFDEFSEKIGEYIGKKKDLIVGNFSTTGTLQRVGSEIVLMDAMSKYFNYGVTTLCSIPVVTLEGEVEDWENIRDRVKVFGEFGLSWWTDLLIPVLDELVQTAKGNPSLDFWRSWYKEGGGSGGPFVSGYVQTFFPYLQGYNDTFYKNTFGHHNSTDLFVKGFSKVPFVWDYYDVKYPMEFIGGINGIAQDDNGAIRASFGWGVRQASVKFENYPQEKLVKDMVVHHMDGDVGKLKKVDCIIYDAISPGQKPSTRLTDVIVEWERKGCILHRMGSDHKLNQDYIGPGGFALIFIKEPACGEGV